MATVVATKKIRRPQGNLRVAFLVCSIVCLVPYVAFWRVSFESRSNLVSASTLQDRIASLQGDDRRIVRWDATEHTVEQQNGGSCELISEVTKVLRHESTDEELVGLALEYLTWCLTDHPGHRAAFAVEGVHLHVVRHLSSSNPHVSASAAHVVYIGTFANSRNHQAFIENGAVSRLSHLIQQQSNLPVTIMWAAAALQNLAANYCDTPDDGRCYWDWKEGRLVMTTQPLLSDGATARQFIAQDKPLVEHLGELIRRGPVHPPQSRGNPFPGDRARTGRDDSSPNLLAWAAAGVLKNLALSPEGQELVESYLPEACKLSKSPDWLEANKGEGILAHMRPGGDPCWDDGCIDAFFYDQENYSCGDYGEATKTECRATDRDGVAASVACCGCGGGVRPSRQNLLFQSLR